MHYCPQSRLHCSCLLTVSSGGYSLSSRFLNCPWPQLPASNKNSSQWLNPSSSSITESQSQSQSSVTTDGQSASLSWCEAPIWGSKPHFCYCQTLVGLLMWGTLSKERMGLSFKIAAGPCQCSHSWVQILWDSWPYFTVSDSRLLIHGGPVPVITSPKSRVAQLYLQALGSLFVASYN
jgi:hypothetical protein